MTRHKIKYLDNGFYQISAQLAKRLLIDGGALPRAGWQKLASNAELERLGLRPGDGKCWIQQTRHNGRMVWAVMI